MDFKYKTSFAGKIRALPSEDGKVATASLSELAKWLPDVDTSVNTDLLPVSFDAAVANRANKNGDIMDTEVALRTIKSFVNKFINLSHNRKLVRGVILNYGFSEFGTNKPLTEDEVRSLNGKPWNMVCGGVIWRVVDKELADYIEQLSSLDGKTEEFLAASWEIGFNDNTILVTKEGGKDIQDGTVIGSEDVNFDRYSNALIMNGGPGKVDGFNVYRNIMSPALALGIGLTENPAADVKGIFVANAEKVEIEIEVEKEESDDEKDSNDKEDKKPEDKESEKSDDEEKCEEDYDCAKCKEKKESEKTEEDEAKCKEDEIEADLTEEEKLVVSELTSKLSEVVITDTVAQDNADTNATSFDSDITGIANIANDIQHFQENLATVIELTVMNSENTNKTTMLTSFADINEEFLKTAQANELREFLEKQVAESAAKASEKLKAEKTAVEAEKAAVAAELETIKAQYEDAKKQLEALVSEKALATAQELFSKRMGYFDEKFELAAEDKQIIAKVLKEVKDDEAFAAYQKDMDILLKGKEKGKQAVASVASAVETVVVNEEKILSKALDNATAEVVTVTAGAPTQDKPKSLFDKYRKAFEYNKENFTNR